MTTTIKISIQQGNNPPLGPFHWKHIVEWNEFSLIDDFVWIKNEDETPPISDLIHAVGVPPTIGMNAIFNAPADHAKSASSETLRKLKVLGFPDIFGSMSEDLGIHLLKRFLMSDEALDAEDPKFQISDPRTPPAAICPDSALTEDQNSAPTAAALHTITHLEMNHDPVEPTVDNETMSEKPENTPSPETPETALSQPATKESVPVTPVETKSAIDPTLNPFIEGDEVDEEEDDHDEHFTPIRKSGPNTLVIGLVLLLLVGTLGAIAAFILMSQKGTTEASNEPSISTPAPEIETTDTLLESAEAIVSEEVNKASEAVVEVGDEVPEAVSEATTETTEPTVSTIEAVEDSNTVTAETSDAESTLTGSSEAANEVTPDLTEPAEEPSSNTTGEDASSEPVSSDEATVGTASSDMDATSESIVEEIESIAVPEAAVEPTEAPTTEPSSVSSESTITIDATAETVKLSDQTEASVE